MYSQEGVKVQIKRSRVLFPLNVNPFPELRFYLPTCKPFLATFITLYNLALLAMITKYGQLPIAKYPCSKYCCGINELC